MNRIVLIVDDDTQLLAAKQPKYSRLLAEGYEVITANNGNDALQLIRDREPAVVVLDLVMPEPDGWRILEELRQMNNASSVVVLSAHPDVAFVVKAMDAGAVNYMHKGSITEEAELAVLKNALLINDTRVKARAQARAIRDLMTTKDVPDSDVLYTAIARGIRSIWPCIANTFMLARGHDGRPHVVYTDADVELKRKVEDEIAFNRISFDKLVGQRTIHLRQKADFTLQSIASANYQSAVVVPSFVFEEGEPTFVQFLLSKESIQVKGTAFLEPVGAFAEVAGVVVRCREMMRQVMDQNTLVVAATEFSHQLSHIVGQLKDHVQKGRASKAEEVIRELCRYNEWLRNAARGLKNDEPANPLPVNALINKVLGEMEVQAERSGVTFRFASGVELPSAACGMYAATTILRNVLSNAIEALEGAKRPDASVDVKAVCDGDRIVVCVTDNGPGIPKEVQERLFNPFVSTKERRGSGLGLMIARTNATRYGGDLCVESQPGKGTVVTWVIPVYQVAGQP